MRAWAEALAVDWIAAGFDPDAFWRQTPRAIQRALRGAARRQRRAMADAALCAWVGAHYNGEALRDFIASLDDSPKPQLSPEAMGRALESMAQKMAVISMDDYRARLRGQA